MQYQISERKLCPWIYRLQAKMNLSFCKSAEQDEWVQLTRMSRQLSTLPVKVIGCLVTCPWLKQRILHRFFAPVTKFMQLDAILAVAKVSKTLTYLTYSTGPNITSDAVWIKIGAIISNL